MAQLGLAGVISAVRAANMRPLILFNSDLLGNPIPTSFFVAAENSRDHMVYRLMEAYPLWRVCPQQAALFSAEVAQLADQCEVSQWVRGLQGMPHVPPPPPPPHFPGYPPVNTSPYQPPTPPPYHDILQEDEQEEENNTPPPPPATPASSVHSGFSLAAPLSPLSPIASPSSSEGTVLYPRSPASSRSSSLLSLDTVPLRSFPPHRHQQQQHCDEMNDDEEKYPAIPEDFSDANSLSQEEDDVKPDVVEEEVMEEEEEELLPPASPPYNLRARNAERRSAAIEAIDEILDEV